MSKANPVTQRLEPVPQDVDLSWIGDEDAGAAFRSYRALSDDERASVLAHAVAALTVPHLANDHDVSGAHEQAVTDLGIDLPSELAEIGAAPFDADIVWNRMNKRMILDAAATRWMPPGLEPTGVPSKSESVPTAAAADAPEAPPVDQD